MADPRHLNEQQAIEALANGAVVALPTESSFALAARLDRPEALAALAHLKSGRGDPIGLMAAHLDAARPWIATTDPTTLTLAARYWPGPLSLIFSAAAHTPSVITAGGDTLALRVPGLEELRNLLLRVGVPVTATSANPPGAAPALDLDALHDYFPELPVWALLPQTAGGPPSTLVDARDGRIRVLRPGPIVPVV